MLDEFAKYMVPCHPEQSEGTFNALKRAEVAKVAATLRPDKVAWKLYGFAPKAHLNEASVVASLTEMYQKLAF